MRISITALAAAAVVAVATGAPATEIPIAIDAPSFALPLEVGTDSLRYARYDLAGGLTVELVAQDGDHFGYWDSGDYDPLPDESVAPFVEDVGDCGNNDDCAPYVATFSTTVDGASIGWSGLLNASGSSASIESGSFFLEAWSGPDGTGTLLARVVDPGGPAEESQLAIGFYPLPEGDGYVTGIEPCINLPHTKGFEKSQGRVAVLAPGETRRFDIRIEAATSAFEVDRLRTAVETLQSRTKPQIFDQPQPGWFRFLMKLLTAVTAMALTVLYAAGPESVWLDYALVAKLTHLAALIALGAAVYFAALWLMGIRIKDFMHRTVI